MSAATYDHDAEAREREEATTTIGGVRFKRRKKTRAVMRDFRQIDRSRDELNEQLRSLRAPVTRLRRQIGEAEDAVLVGKLEDQLRRALDQEDSAEIDAVIDLLEDGAYERICLFLVKAETDEPPVREFLEEHLDALDDLPRLMTWALGDEPRPTSPDEDSTTPIESTSR